MTSDVLAGVPRIERRRQAPEREAKLWHQSVAALQRLSFLSEAGRALSETLDPAAVIAKVVDCTVPTVAQWCLVDLVDDEGRLALMAHADVDPKKAELLKELRRKYPPHPETHPVHRVFRSGRAELWDKPLRGNSFRELARDEEHLRLLKALGPSTYVCAPIKAAGRTIGVLSVGNGPTGRLLNMADLKLVEDLGLRAGLAIHNSRLYQKARQADDSLTRALTAARMVAWTWDLATDRIARSDNAAEIYGISQNVDCGPGLRRVHPKDRQRYEEVLRDAVARCGSYVVQFRLRRDDGALLWLEDQGTVERDPFGRPARLCGVVRDVTDRKAAEDTLHIQNAAARILWSARSVPTALRAFLRTVGERFDWQMGFAWQADNASGLLRQIGHWTADAVSSGEAKELVDWPQIFRGTELPGLIWTRGKATWIGHLDQYSRFPRARAAAQAGMKAAFLFPIVGQNGLHAVIEFLCAEDRRPVPGLSDLFEGVGKHFSQYIERQRAQVELRQQQVEQQTILDSLNAMVWFKDAENRILRCNRAAAQWCGAPVGEIEGKSAYELFPEQASKYHEDDLAVIGSGKPLLGHIEQTVSPRGQKRWIRRDMVPYSDGSGKPAGVIILAVDITEIKEAEDVLRESERTQKEFVANVSHEFRTPVAAIKGFAETLLNGGLTDERNRRRFVRIIQNHADRLGWLVEDVLTLSSLESGKELQLEPTDLAEFVSDFLAGVPQWDKGRDVIICSGVARGLIVPLDRRYFSQILENLLTNAVKYNRPRGHVWIEAESLDAGVRLTVRDDGIGIAPADLRRIFDRFFRVEKGAAQGHTGLGLHICKKIVEAHGGDLWAESEVGKGSAFHVLLPSAPIAAGESKT